MVAGSAQIENKGARLFRSFSFALTKGKHVVRQDHPSECNSSRQDGLLAAGAHLAERRLSGSLQKWICRRFAIPVGERSRTLEYSCRRCSESKVPFSKLDFCYPAGYLTVFRFVKLYVLTCDFPMIVCSKFRNTAILTSECHE